MYRLFFFFFLLAFLNPIILVGSDTLATSKNKEEKIKDGWTFGAVPVVAYDSDLGFKYSSA